MTSAMKIPVTNANGGGALKRANAARHKINTTFLAVLGKFSNVAIQENFGNPQETTEAPKISI